MNDEGNQCRHAQRTCSRVSVMAQGKVTLEGVQHCLGENLLKTGGKGREEEEGREQRKGRGELRSEGVERRRKRRRGESQEEELGGEGEESGRWVGS